MSHVFTRTYLSRFDNPDTIMLGDIGAMEKLYLETTFRDVGLEPIEAAAMAGIWSNVVHLKCKYTDNIYCRLRDNLRVLPEGSFRDSIRTRFLVALGLNDFPNLDNS